jgi:hypothetical protein
MAVVLKKKRKKRQPELLIETPALNLLDGKFMYKYSSRKLRKLEGYVSRYSIRMALKDDDSPIKRAVLMLENRRGAPSTQFAMPIVFWEMLYEQLGEYLEELRAEMLARGESKLAYKLKRSRGA